jgi:hypothetical protein
MSDGHQLLIVVIFHCWYFEIDLQSGCTEILQTVCHEYLADEMSFETLTTTEK